MINGFQWKQTANWLAFANDRDHGIVPEKQLNKEKELSVFVSRYGS